MNSAPRHTILHLTDLHFGYDGKDETLLAQRQNCLDGLLGVLADLHQSAVDWRIDTVLVSGDIGWRGERADYEKAQAWFEQLAQVCQIQPAQIVLAPGNHDSLRDKAKRVPRPHAASVADTVLKPPLADIAQAAAFSHFCNFAQQGGYAALQLGQESGYLAGVATLAGLRVLVLNSAWCAQGDDDQNRLWLGLPQLQVMQAKRQIGLVEAGCPLTVALMHHPFDWLHEAEKHAFDKRPATHDYLSNRAHLLLTGHTHAEIKEPGLLTKTCWHFASGASFAEAAHFNSFRLLQIEGNQCRYRTWEFDPRNSKQAWREQQADSVTLAGLAATPAHAKASTASQSCPSAPSAPQIEIERLQAYVSTHLPGREPELARLRAAWARAGARTSVNAGAGASTGAGTSPPMHASAPMPASLPIVAIIALGGEGKTSVLAHWMAEMQANGWQGAQAVYAWSFYSQGSSEQSASSADLFLHDALVFFGETDFANSNASAWDKGKKLAECCARQRTLLLLDGVEPLQYPPASTMRGELKDNGLLALLRGLAARQAGSLCVLTSRYELPQIKAYCDQIDLPHLPMEAAVALLRQHCSIGSEQDFQNAVQEVRGHALSLNILAHYIAEAHDGDIRQRDLLNWKQADIEERHGHAFRAMAAYQRWLEQGDLPANTTTAATTSTTPPHNQRALALLYALCLFDRPAERTLLDALLAHPIPCPQLAALQNLTPAEWNLCISRLQQANLLRRLPAQGAWHTLDAHPLLREYFADHWQNNDLPAFQAAHGRLFDYLQNQTKEGETPTMQDLQPLYQAVAHGCCAGLYREALYKVYWDRILRGKEHYSINKLGAYAADLSAVACFFSQPWQRVVPALPAPEQAFLLSQAAFHLRALGRLAEAVPAFEASLAMDLEQQDWEGAAATANNLAELQLQLGQVAVACGQAEQAMAYADQSADAFWRMASRTTLADCQHQHGQSTALALMQQAEFMQQESGPDYPLLYSLRGFLYCELLLASGRATRAQVAARARQTLAWDEEENWLLDIALDHLSLARCGGPDALDEAHQAVAGLRQAGNSNHLPRALLTRAELFCHHSQMQAALDDLNEAFDLCERCGLQLLLCDTLLTRLALFGQAKPYPWPSASADLAQATALVKDCGYERRRAALDNPALVLWQADAASPN